MTSMGVDGEKTCSHCGAPMHQAQDWCINCGSGASSAAGPRPGWRSAALAIGATGALALGASAAAYAALQQSPARRPAHVAQTPTTGPAQPGTATTPGQTTPGSTIPATPGGSPAPTSPPSLKTPSSLPRIPSSTPTPTTNGKGSAQAITSSPTGGTGSNGNKGSNAGKGPGGTGKPRTGANPPGKAHENSEEQVEGNESGAKSGQPVAILLDTDAAHLYNPGKLAAGRFGDPSLAIDGDVTTAWTVQLEPAEAPSVGAGLALNLNASLSVAKLMLTTETVGITVQIYGTTSATPPESLSSEGWVRLSKQHVVKRRNATIELVDSKKRFKQLLLWIVKAPTAAGGQFTGSEVAIDELQLYEPRSPSR